MAVEEILPGIYRIEIPLPRSPLKALNSYLIKAAERFLVIDTGWRQEECQNIMLSHLEKLKVDLRRTDFFITHLHADHLGLVADLATATSTVYFNQKEITIISDGTFGMRWPEYCKFYQSHGFPEDHLEKALDSHPGQRYGLKQPIDFRTVKEADTIDIGDYSFRCIETPGHSPGHTCLYEPSKKILISGDHLLQDITPNITAWLEMKDSLKEYLASLDKVYPLDVDLVLPGHRNAWHNHRKRITELQEHHQARLKEIISALEEGGKTAFETAPYVTWNIDYRSWEQFPAPQKWFAVGETIAHMEYLEGKKRLQRESREGKIVFSLV